MAAGSDDDQAKPPPPIGTGGTRRRAKALVGAGRFSHSIDATGCDATGGDNEGAQHQGRATVRDRRRPPDGPARWQVELAGRCEQARQRARESAGRNDDGIKHHCGGTGHVDDAAMHQCDGTMHQCDSRATAALPPDAALCVRMADADSESPSVLSATGNQNGASQPVSHMAEEKVTPYGGICGSSSRIRKPIPDGSTENTSTLWNMFKKVKHMRVDLEHVNAQTKHIILEAESLERAILECIAPLDAAEIYE